MENQNLETRIKEKKLQMFNYFCKKDFTLWMSLALERFAPIGLFGAQNPLIQNKHFHLTARPNLHLSTISDPKFISEIIKI